MEDDEESLNNEDTATQEPSLSTLDERQIVEAGIMKITDTLIRELVKLKIMDKPKGTKEEKARMLVDGCLAEDSDDFLDKICDMLLTKHKLPDLENQLRLLARPPPEPEVDEDEMAAEAESEAQDQPIEALPVIVANTGPRPKTYTAVLRDSTATLVDCLDLNEGLLDHLQNKGVVNAEMRTKILCCSHRGEKIHLLLKFLMQLGPESLQHMICGLRDTNQDFLANILDAKPFT